MSTKKEYTWVEEIENGDMIQCPKCANEVMPAKNIDWDYIDGEEHIIKCPCGNELEIICDRPIVFQISTLKQ